MAISNSAQDVLRLALPKGRIQAGVFGLLEDAGIRITLGSRAYRPILSLTNFEAKLLKPQGVVEMLAAASRDIGFAGRDWVVELGADVVELLDTGLDPVRLVVAAPRGFRSAPSGRPLIVASEYQQIAIRWAKKRGLNARVLRSWGASEVLPPEDADLIIDNTQSGATLEANGLEIQEVIMSSSTCLFASTAVAQNAALRPALDSLVLLLNSVLEARKRIMLKLNIERSKLDNILAILPALRSPTISALCDVSAVSVQSAVKKVELAELIPELRRRGATDIVVSQISQVI